MATIVTPLTDGGRVEVEWVNGGQLKVQKYDASGAPVGPQEVSSPLMNSAAGPEVVALAGGGYVVVTTFASKGGALIDARVYDTGGPRVATLDLPGGGHGYDIAASPDGGFLVVSMEKGQVPPGGGQPDTQYHPFLTLYDNSGQVVRGPVQITGDLPTITVQADGDYLVQWNDGGIARTLEIDPSNPPALAKPAAPTLTILDDQGKFQGPVTDWSTDATPVARVAVTQVGTVLVTRHDGGTAWEKSLDGGVQVTQADVDRGYIDIPVIGFTGDGMPSTWYARFKSADGVVSDPVQDSFSFILRPEIWTVTDDVGPQTGALANGATTDDSTPTLQIGLESSGMKAGETLYVRENGTAVGQTVLTADDVARGYANITTTPLSNGEHTLYPHLGGPNLQFKLTVAASSSAPADNPATLKDWSGAANTGQSLVNLGGNEHGLPGGSYEAYSTGTLHQFYVSAPDGVKTLVIDGHTVIADGVFTPSSWEASFGLGTFTIRSFDPDTGKVTIIFNLEEAVRHNPGASQAFFNTSVTLTDTDGDQTSGRIDVTIYDDLPRVSADTATAQVGAGAVTGQLFANDGSADGLSLWGMGGAQTSGTVTLNGARGVLTVQSNGHFSYTANNGATNGTDTFTYEVVDGDGDRASSTLSVRVEEAPSGASGRVIQSPGPGSTLTGGTGDDTLIASQGPDQLTGGAGADVFRWTSTPWQFANVTDFRVGIDRLDLSPLLQQAGYTGSDPVADKYIWIVDRGADAGILFDPDGAGPNPQWPHFVVNLQNVETSGLTWAQLAGAGGGNPPPPTGSTVNISPATVTHAEGNSGLTAYSFTLTRTGDTSQVATTAYRVQGSGERPADSGDFQNGWMPSVSFGWNAGETSKTITVYVTGDTAAEGDETFSVVLQANSGGSNPTAVGPNSTAVGVITNDDGAGSGTPGQVYTSPGPGSTLQGGAGNDTLIASQGADVLTGNGGADTFAYRDMPWSAGRITDFAIGSDRLDLSGVFQDIGYSGSDPVADSHVRLVNALDGRSTHVYIDRDGAGTGDQWGTFAFTLEGVYGGGAAGARSSLTWAQLTGSGGGSEPPPPPPPPPPSGDGQVLRSDQYGDTIVGGAGNDTLHAGQGPDQLTGAGGADHFVYGALPWNAGRITDFTPGTDKLDLSGLFDAASGGSVEFRGDGQGNTQVYFDRDAPNSGDWPFLITTLQGVAPGQIGAADWIA
ncbi:type I secretion C-terminal target domain-containing protein [Phenylobacterium sp.]|jgi:hypothetical protein|uniref:type I secretion C-terminal target domain-containing protein n=1 Tax=Phenylobacterium sp. TaxID=1871053 RepID=UPI002F95F045